MISPTREFNVGAVPVGGRRPFLLIAGPCVIENAEHCYWLAGEIKSIAASCGVSFIFKASYDKANRSSLSSFRGVGLEKGLEILRHVRQDLKVPVLTDVHDVSQVGPVSTLVDCLQIPAFLCRQTDLLVAAGQSGVPVNVKKGQFLSPGEVQNIVDKLEDSGCQKILLTERGTSFGYNNLVVDIRSFPLLRRCGYPVIFDVTHSLQLPGGLGTTSGGQPEFVEVLARAGVAAGVDGVFIEVHENPDKALSDGANALPLDRLESALMELREIDQIIKRKI